MKFYFPQPNWNIPNKFKNQWVEVRWLTSLFLNCFWGSVLIILKQHTIIFRAFHWIWAESTAIINKHQSPSSTGSYNPSGNTLPPPCFTDDGICMGYWALAFLLYTLLFFPSLLQLQCHPYKSSIYQYETKVFAKRTSVPLSVKLNVLQCIINIFLSKAQFIYDFSWSCRKWQSSLPLLDGNRNPSLSVFAYSEYVSCKRLPKKKKFIISL